MKTKEIIEEFIRRKTLPNVSNEYIKNILVAWNNEEWINKSDFKKAIEEIENLNMTKKEYKTVKWIIEEHLVNKLS